MAVVTTNLGTVTAYGDAVAAGYTGTKAQWQALMANYATVGTQAAQSAQTASTAAQTATTKASEASASATAAAASAASIGTPDTTLTQSGKAADAKTVGDELSTIKEDFTAMVNSAYVTDSASGSVAHFVDGAGNIPMKSVKVLLEPIQSGSGDASPSNVRPISGHSGTVKVTRAGKNLAQPLSKTESGLTLTPQADGSLKINGTFSGATGWFVISKNFLVKANQAYALSISGTTNTFGLNGFGSANPVTPIADFTTNLRLRIENGQTFNNAVIRPQVEVGTSATDFEPYIDSTSYDISIASAGTVYGGTLDVVSGELTVDKGFVTLDGTQTIVNRNWRATSNSVGWLYPYSVTQNVVPNSSTEVPDVISNRVKTASYSAAYNGTENNCVSFVYDTSKTYGLAVRYDNTLLTTDAAINAFLAENPIQVVYSLATPLTYQLTATEIKSLLGINNVWSDAGDVEVEYRADTKLYIDKRLGV